jgi:hypothetical protein
MSGTKTLKQHYFFIKGHFGIRNGLFFYLLISFLTHL